MAQEIIRYKCDSCKKHFANSHYTKKHENICFANSGTKACRTCKNNILLTDPISRRSFHFCSNTNRRIYIQGEVITHCFRWESSGK